MSAVTITISSPVPIFGEYGVNSVTDTVILRRFK